MRSTYFFLSLPLFVKSVVLLMFLVISSVVCVCLIRSILYTAFIYPGPSHSRIGRIVTRSYQWQSHGFQSLLIYIWVMWLCSFHVVFLASCCRYTSALTTSDTRIHTSSWWCVWVKSIIAYVCIGFSLPHTNSPVSQQKNTLATTALEMSKSTA